MAMARTWKIRQNTMEQYDDKPSFLSTDSQTKPPMSQESYDFLMKTVRDFTENGTLIFDKQVDVDYCHQNEAESTSLEIERFQIQPVQTEIVSDYSKPVTSPDSQSRISYYDQMSPNLPESSQIHSSPTVPSNVPYTGEYGFEIGFQKQIKDTKSVTWTYSESLKKLYAKMECTCPIKFKTSKHTPSTFYIRAMPIYMKPEHVREVVKRCANHASKDSMAVDAHHLIRCEHKLAEYYEDEYTRRLSITFPHEQPQPGAEWVTNLFQFMCFSSCVGGLNRRPIEVVFTLEDIQGNVLGRQSVEVRICACPGRDRKSDEKNHNINNMNLKESTGQLNNKPKMSVNTEITVAAKRQRLDDDEEIFTVHVKGRDNYEIITRIRDSLELAALVPAQQKENHRKQRQRDKPEAVKRTEAASRNRMARIKSEYLFY